jgi:hypothetical protein
MLAAQTFNNFGGLRLDVGLDEAGADQAIDLLDVDWEGGDGALRPRDGAAGLLAEDADEAYNACFSHSDGFVIARKGENELVAISVPAHVEVTESSEEGAATIVTSGGHLSFTRMGTPAAAYTYIAERESRLKRYRGFIGFTTPTVSVDGAGGKQGPSPSHVATWPDGGNRLVLAGLEEGPNKLAASQSHVWFSEPGDAESYESTAFEQLSPGDGEEIVGCVEWNGQIFVFKETNLFVFYGVETDEEGKPKFNFRTIHLPARVRQAHPNGNGVVAAGDEGVYFLTNKGIYWTSGGAPVSISEALGPLGSTRELAGPAAATFGKRRWSNAGQGLFFLDGYLYGGLGEEPEGRSDLLLRFDTGSGRWTVWSANLHCMTSCRLGLGTYPLEDRVLFSGADTAQNLYRYEHRLPGDEDPTVESSPRWQSGFYDLESEDEKTLTQARVWGTGSVAVSSAKDFGALGNAKTFTLGTAPQVKSAQKQRTQTGVLHSHQFSGPGPWSVQRFVRYMETERVPDTEAK